MKAKIVMLGIILLLAAGGFSLADDPGFPVGNIGPVYYTHSPYEEDVPQEWVGETVLLKGWAYKTAPSGTYPERAKFYCSQWLYCEMPAWLWGQGAGWYEKTAQGPVGAGTLHIEYYEPPQGFAAVLDLDSFEAMAWVNVQGNNE